VDLRAAEAAAEVQLATITLLETAAQALSVRFG